MARRDRLVDSAFFAFALVAGAALFSNQARQGELPDWAVALGTLGGLAACGALWVRRRWPVGRDRGDPARRRAHELRRAGGADRVLHRRRCTAGSRSCCGSARSG